MGHKDHSPIEGEVAPRQVLLLFRLDVEEKLHPQATATSSRGCRSNLFLQQVLELAKAPMTAPVQEHWGMEWIWIIFDPTCV